MARSKCYRKTGALTKRSKLARKRLRDGRIYRLLRLRRQWSERKHELYREDRGPLSVYIGKPDQPNGDKLTKFPVTHQSNGQPMPSWDDLTSWLKVRLLVMGLHEWGLQTFTVHLRSDLESKWIAEGKDPLIEISIRMRKEMAKLVGEKAEHFFIIEGWCKKKRQEVRLHIHGAGFIRQAGDGPKIVEAAARACGQGVRGHPREPRSVHGKVYWNDRSNYVDYLFKSVRRKDRRLGSRRLHMSQEAVGAGREFWLLITEPR